MYFWKVDNLVEDFKTGKVTQLEEFKYMLLFTVIGTIAFDSLLCTGSAYNYYDYINLVLTLTISIWGVYYCYKINKEGDNKGFIVRLTCIGLPVVIRILAFFIPIFFLIGALEEALIDIDSVAVDELESEFYETTPLEAAAFVLFTTSYYLYLSRKIRAVSS